MCVKVFITFLFFTYFMTDTYREESSLSRVSAAYASPKIFFFFDLIIISMATNCNIKIEHFAFK